MKRKFDQGSVSNSNFNAFVRDVVENEYNVKDLLRMITTINPHNLELQPEDMQDTKKRIIVMSNKETIEQTEGGGHLYRGSMIFNFKDKKTADLFENVYKNLIQSEKVYMNEGKRINPERAKVIIEDQLIKAGDDNSLKRFREMRDMPIKDYKIKNNGKGAVLITMTKPLEELTKDPEAALGISRRKIVSQIFDEVVNATLNSGLYQSTEQVNNLQKKMNKDVYVKDGKAVVPTKATKSALKLYAIERSDKVSEEIKKQIQLSSSAMLNTKVMALQRDTAEALMGIEESKVARLLKQRERVTQKEVNNPEPNGLRSLLQKVGNTAKQALDNVVTMAGETFEQPALAGVGGNVEAIPIRNKSSKNSPKPMKKM